MPLPLCWFPSITLLIKKNLLIFLAMYYANTPPSGILHTSLNCLMIYIQLLSSPPCHSWVFIYLIFFKFVFNSLSIGKPLTLHLIVGWGSPSASHNKMPLLPVLYTALWGFFFQRGGSEHKTKRFSESVSIAQEQTFVTGLHFYHTPAEGRHHKVVHSSSFGLVLQSKVDVLRSMCMCVGGDECGCTYIKFWTCK